MAVYEAERIGIEAPAPTPERGEVAGEIAVRATLQLSNRLPQFTRGVKRSIQVYLDEIGQIDLLTAEQEVELALDIRGGEQARERLADGSLDRVPVEILADRELITQSQRAREQYIAANLRLVVTIAKKYQNRGVELLDLIQFGNIGLIRGVEGFDPDKGFRFSTYASWWIRQGIQQGIADTSRTIRFTSDVHDAIQQIQQARSFIEDEMKVPATVERLVYMTRFNKEQVHRVLRYEKETQVSINAKLRDDSDTELGDILPDRFCPPVEESGIAPTMRKDIADVLSELDEKQRAVVKLRFGLEDGIAHTQQEIADKFGVSKNRIWQIEHAAMRKLQNPQSRASGLLAYIQY